MHTHQKTAMKSTKSNGHLSGELIYFQVVASIVLILGCLIPVYAYLPEEKNIKQLCSSQTFAIY